MYSRKVTNTENTDKLSFVLSYCEKKKNLTDGKTEGNFFTKSVEHST